MMLQTNYYYIDVNKIQGPCGVIDKPLGCVCSIVEPKCMSRFSSTPKVFVAAFFS